MSCIFVITFLEAKHCTVFEYTSTCKYCLSQESNDPYVFKLHCSENTVEVPIGYKANSFFLFCKKNVKKWYKVEYNTKEKAIG